MENSLITDTNQSANTTYENLPNMNILNDLSQSIKVESTSHMQNILQQIQLLTHANRLETACPPLNGQEGIIITNSEMIQVYERVQWLNTCQDTQCSFPLESTVKWIEIGTRKVSIENECSYCDSNLLRKILEVKKVFDELDPVQLCKARSRANPFETVKSAFFMNRAALKIANIDAATDFLFSGVDRQSEHKQYGKLYYFADICAGPGAFTEYILWRKQWAFKGFGLTLKGEHDFKLQDSICAPYETFEPLYGSLDNGDVCYPENINDFCQKVRRESDGMGLHFLMADGGFSVEGRENLQEVLSQQIYVCQCLTALTALRRNGHCVIKMFDLFTPFSVGLIFLMYHCFQRVAIFKPNASRPANSERYLICSCLRDDNQTNDIRTYMEHVVQTFFKLRSSTSNTDVDINEIVPESIIKRDRKFCDYVTQSNNRLAQRQIIGLEKLMAFYHDPLIIEPRQEQFRMQCLAFWQIPDRPKLPLPFLTCPILISSSTNDAEFLFSPTIEIQDVDKLGDILKEKQRWHCTFVSSTSRTNFCNIYVGCGGDRVYRFRRGRFIREKNIELVRGTILIAEHIKDQSANKILHVVDALRLGDTSLADLPYKERLELIRIYCDAINKRSRPDLSSVRCKNVFRLSKLTEENLPVLNEAGKWIYTHVDVDDVAFKYEAKSILFLKTDSSQTFNSTASFRLMMKLPDAKDDRKSESDFLLQSFVLILSQNAI